MAPEVSHAALRALAESVAREAADHVRSARHSGVQVAGTKSSSVDLVTETDQATERLLRELLSAARPDDGFVGEEGDDQSSRSGVTWVVDPIDGTVNFVYGIPEYAVSVAAQVEGGSVAGAVVNAASGAVYSAALGQGATRDGRPLRVRAVPPMGQRLLLTGFSYEAEQRTGAGSRGGAHPAPRARHPPARFGRPGALCSRRGFCGRLHRGGTQPLGPRGGCTHRPRGGRHGHLRAGRGGPAVPGRCPC